MPTPSTQRPQVGLWTEHRRIAGWVVLSGPGLLGVLWMAAGLLVEGQPLLQLAAAPALLTALVLLGVRRRLAVRADEAQGGPAAPAQRRRPAFLLGLGGAVATGLVWMFGHRVPALLALGAAPAPWLTGAVLGSLVVLGALLLALFARFYATTDRALLPEARGVAALLRACAWTSLLVGLHLLAPSVYPPAVGLLHTLAQWVGGVVLGIVLLELCVRGASRRPARLDPSADLFLLSLVASRWNPLSSLFGTLTDAFGIDLRGTWSLRFIQRSLAPLALGLVLLGWVASAFTVVGTSEVGVLETFGAPSEAEPVGAGLAVHWPWPIQRVRRVDTERVRAMPIGFVGEDREASLMWTRRHAEEEYALLLGDGQDLVTVNAILNYRVADPRAFLYANSDADAALAALADRALMRVTVGRTLDEVLSENVAALCREVEQDLRQAADELGLGLEVLGLDLIGLHPPMAVARDYQAVVGAQIERETLKYEAEADREQALPLAAAGATRTKSEAEADAARRQALARGEAQAFEAQVEASRRAPDLFRYRRLLEARERQLRGRPFVVVDERFERQGAVIRAVGAPSAEEDR